MSGQCRAAHGHTRKPAGIDSGCEHLKLLSANPDEWSDLVIKEDCVNDEEDDR